MLVATVLGVGVDEDFMPHGVTPRDHVAEEELSLIVIPNNLCRSTTLLPGAALTTTSGSLVREGNQLTAQLEFRYEISDSTDHGRLVWGYTGTRQ